MSSLVSLINVKSNSILKHIFNHVIGKTYKALTCSASQPICDPHGILVVKDCITQYFADVILLDDGGDSKEPTREIAKDKLLENNVSDGFNLCTIQYMQRVTESLGLEYVPGGVCLRNAWLKGIEDLYNKDILTKEQEDFLFWYERKMPVGTGNCSMNQICKYVESQLDGYKSQLHKDSEFDYNVLKVKRRCTEEHRQTLRELEQY